MKTNWLSYVAIAAAILSGSVCSTAFAGPPSFKFGGSSGGGNLRIGGSNNSGNSGNTSRQFTPRIGNLNGNVQGTNMQAQIKKIQGNGIPSGIGQAINGNGGGNSSRVINPGIKIGNLQQNGGNSGGSNPRVTLPGNVLNQLQNSGKLPVIGNGNGNGNGGLGIPKIGKIDPGFSKPGNVQGNIGQAIGNAILGNGNSNHHHGQGSIQCGPVKVGCKPWWDDCHHFHHNHCYKPVYPVCTKTIVVQVPVVVEQVAVAQPVMQVPVGSTLTLQALGLGHEAGQVMLQVDKIAIPAMVNEWTDGAVTTTLPMLGLGGQVIADIVLVRADGTVANSIKVELINALPQTAAAAPAGAVQPAGFQADQGGAAAALGGL
jgi:hypothetical protein